MKITFIMPAASDGFNSYNYKFPGWINHGIAILSTIAKKEGFQTDLIDFRRLSGWNDYAIQFKKKMPNILAISAVTSDYNIAVKAAKIAKHLNQDIIIIVGGPHPTLVPSDFEKIPEIDYIFKGEGDISFSYFLKNIKNAKTRKKIPKIICGISPQNLDKTPFADRELFGPYEAPIHSSFPTPFMSIISTRGCMYNCSFCQPAERNLHGSKVRHRSVDNMLEELVLLEKKYGMKSFMIHDDNFIQDKKWLNEFIEKYPKKLRLPFACQGRADIIVREQEAMKRLSQIGLRTIMIGFESGNQRILNLLRKGTTVEQNLKSARICKKYGIMIWANYMFGIPTETRKEMMDTIRMIKKINPEMYSPAILTPTPGSDLYDYCVENNLLLIKNYNDFARNTKKAKIKGVDYKFVLKIFNKSLPLKIRVRKRLSSITPMWMKKIIRKII